MQKHFIGLKASWKESPFRVYTACRRERSPLPFASLRMDEPESRVDFHRLDRMVAEALRMMDSRLSLTIRD